jgi:hypothetical protein
LHNLPNGKGYIIGQGGDHGLRHAVSAARHTASFNFAVKGLAGSEDRVPARDLVAQVPAKDLSRRKNTDRMLAE